MLKYICASHRNLYSPIASFHKKDNILTQFSIRKTFQYEMTEIFIPLSTVMLEMVPSLRKYLLKLLQLKPKLK